MKKRIKLLLIDDNLFDRKIYRRFLSAATKVEFEIIEAETAADGVSLCKTHQPDCIVIDYRLPDQSGLATLEQIRNLSGVPVVFITGEPDALTMTEAYRRGASKYVSKDLLDSQKLQDAILEVIKVAI